LKVLDLTLDKINKEKKGRTFHAGGCKIKSHHSSHSQIAAEEYGVKLCFSNLTLLCWCQPTT
jgi:hypothetical protein